MEAIIRRKFMEGLTKTNSLIPHKKGATWLEGGPSMDSWRINSRQLRFLSLCSPRSSSNSSKPTPTFVPSSNPAFSSFFRLKQKNSRLSSLGDNKLYPHNSNSLFLTRATKQLPGDEVRSHPTENKYTLRPLADFPPSGWGDYFVSYPLSTIETISMLHAMLQNNTSISVKNSSMVNRKDSLRLIKPYEALDYTTKLSAISCL